MLMYCLITVPLQLSFWNFDQPCYVAPTLSFDMVTDVFFLASIRLDRLPPSYSAPFLA
jgi:hypothetical protein